MPEINLIKLEGKPFEKLIDVISKGIGTLYKPRSIRKNADAKAYKIQVIEEARTKAENAGKELEAESYLRIQERLIANEIERQESIDKVVEIAAEQLKKEKNISEDPVDKDWAKRFFDIAQDITDEEMQALWGRILAGETKEPRSYSKRTLETLKNLSKEEAKVFTKFAQARIISGNNHLIYNNDNGNFIKKAFGINFGERLLLTELGLIASENNLEFSLNPTNGNQITNHIRYGHKIIIFNRKENTPKQNLKVLVFTKVGIELSKLIEQDINRDYLYEICGAFDHPNVKIEFGDLVGDPNHLFIVNKQSFS